MKKFKIGRHLFDKKILLNSKWNRKLSSNNTRLHFQILIFVGWNGRGYKRSIHLLCTFAWTLWRQCFRRRKGIRCWPRNWLDWNVRQHLQIEHWIVQDLVDVHVRGNWSIFLIQFQLLQKYNFGKIAPRLSFKKPEFMLRCFCNFDLCNRESNFFQYIDSLKTGSTMMAKNAF